jgi:hypothetical protein
VVLPVVCLAQAPPKDYTDLRNQRDIIDLYNYVFRRDSSFTRTDSAKRPGKVYFALGAAGGYTQQTGLAVAGTLNFAFITSASPEQNLSTIFLSPTATQRRQLYLPIATSIWSRDNRYNLVSDVRIIRNVQDTYGIGSATTEANRYTMTYSFLRIHATLLRALGRDWFAGAGIALDEFWSVKEEDVPAGLVTDFQRYGYSTTAHSNGLEAQLLHDTRRNSLNPVRGRYASIILRHNPRWLGSDREWTSLTLDLRTYLPWPPSSHNVLALWSYSVIVLGGRPPYVDLPGTGLDASNNTGRGYPTGRFRGTTMLDLEAEYRIQLSRNGLFGMVIFGSVQTLSNYPNNRLQSLAPAAGAGIRMKFNKYSRANISFDYGVGLYGANNLLLNVGEVF